MSGEEEKKEVPVNAEEKPDAGKAEEPTTTADDGDDAPAGEEEDTGAQIAPLVRLEEVSISTGEEDENVLFEIKSKLYRFDKEGNQWKERGVGQAKLLEHKESKRIRLLMRQLRTLKICANHAILPHTVLQEHAGNDKSLVWHASDFSEGELKDELFTMRFGSVESAQKFKAAYEDAQKKMKALLGDTSAPQAEEAGEEDDEGEDDEEEGEGEEKADETADEAAKSLEALKVADKEEEKAGTPDSKPGE